MFLVFNRLLMNLMWFWDIGVAQWDGVRADDPERILEPSLVQNDGLLKHGDRTCGHKELLHQKLLH